MVKPLILSVLLLVGLMVCTTLSTDAADDKPAQGNDLTKKFVLVSRVIGDGAQSDLLKRIEFRKLGNREFLVGEYRVNADLGVDKEWEGVQLWVPVENIEAMIVFADEAKAWGAVKAHGVPKDDK